LDTNYRCLVCLRLPYQSFPFNDAVLPHFPSSRSIPLGYCEKAHNAPRQSFSTSSVFARRHKVPTRQSPPLVFAASSLPVILRSETEGSRLAFSSPSLIPQGQVCNLPVLDSLKTDDINSSKFLGKFSSVFFYKFKPFIVFCLARKTSIAKI
jgi:hypothetical protein